MNFNLDTIIKISIAVAITASLTMNIHFQTVNNNTINNYANQTVEKIEQLENSTEISDQQAIKILKQILKEVK